MIEKVTKNIYKTFNIKHPVYGIYGFPSTKKTLKIKQYGELIDQLAKENPIAENELKGKALLLSLVKNDKDCQSISEQFCKKHNLDKSKLDELSNKLNLSITEIDDERWVTFSEFNANDKYYDSYVNQKLQYQLFREVLFSRGEMFAKFDIIKKNKDIFNDSSNNTPVTVVSKLRKKLCVKLYAKHTYETEIIPAHTQNENVNNNNNNYNNNDNDNNSKNNDKDSSNNSEKKEKKTDDTTN